MKLELKHLAAYLPYELKCKTYSNRKMIGELTNLRKDLCILNDEFEWGWGFNFKDIKPIFHPLSNLIKEIEVNGHKFIPLEVLNLNINAKYDMPFVNKKSAGFIYGFASHRVINIKNIDNNSYWHITRLLEWHFDIFGLIENNLGININEL